MPVSVEMTAAKTARFLCRVGGRPQPQVSWFKNGEEIKLNGNVKAKDTLDGHRLTISQVTASDTGYYQCRASSPVGMVQGTSLLKVIVSGVQCSLLLIYMYFSCISY